MKKISFIVACLTFMLNTFNVNASDNQINVIINGNAVAFTSETGYPYVDDNKRTMVPLRVTMESAGAAVGFDSNKKTAIIITEHDRIEVPLGVNYLYNNNQKIMNDTSAVINNGRIYLPIRAVLESADYTVEYDKSTQSVNAYNFTFDSTAFIPYSTSNFDTLLTNILKGNVIYINGNYYTTPEYVKMIANTQVHYSGNDLNISIYPQQNRYALADLNYADIEWISGISNFDKILVSENSIDKSVKSEPSDIPGFVYLYCFYKDGITGIKVIYPVDEMTESFINSDNATGEFNGIRMKKEDSILYFNYQDLKNLGLYQ